MVGGYAHGDYARALAEYGRPRELSRCGGWILERGIPGFPVLDAMGCYPLFACRDWSGLKADLDEIGTGLVSLSLVADPLGSYTVEELQASFDLIKPFKEHVVVDLCRPRREVVSKHHRKIARRALRKLSVERCESPLDYLDEWAALYGHLAERHSIRETRVFSRESLRRQMQVPGASFFVAKGGNEVVGAALSYQQGDVVQAHLTAFSETGYKLAASYAIKWTQLEYYGDKARWFNLQGVPGADDSGSEGLRQYKLGWSPQTKTAYLCGRIFDRPMYEEIVKAKGAAAGSYFPAYRNGELT